MQNPQKNLYKKHFGAKGEKLVCNHLKKLGYKENEVVKMHSYFSNLHAMTIETIKKPCTIIVSQMDIIMNVQIR